MTRSNYFSGKEGSQVAEHKEWQSRHREEDPQVLRQIQSVSSPGPPSSKYGHFWLQKNKRSMEGMPN